MAKKPVATKRRAATKKPATTKAAAPPKKSARRTNKPSPQRRAKRTEAPRAAANPRDLVGEFLESPLVADTLAAGAAAALAVFVQRGLSRRDEESSSKQALKRAGKAAAAAMGQKLAEEFDAILEKAKSTREEG